MIRPRSVAALRRGGNGENPRSGIPQVKCEASSNAYVRRPPWRRRLPHHTFADVVRTETQTASAGAPSPRRWRGLTDAEERRVVLAAAAGDPGARTRVVEVFRPGVAGIARLYRGAAHVSREELMQEGVVGLLRALERFDSDRGTPFWAYACWWVRQAMQQLVSELGRPVVLSDRAVRRLARIRNARRELLQSLEREPSIAELASRAELTREQVESLLAVERAPRALDEAAGEREGSTVTLCDLIADPVSQDGYDHVDEWSHVAQLRDLPGTLPGRERDIVRAHFGLDGERQTLREIAGRIGLSVERVRQLEERALGRLRAAVAD
jgi:RNA polymerase primary sigma factor